MAREWCRECRPAARVVRRTNYRTTAAALTANGTPTRFVGERHEIIVRRLRALDTLSEANAERAWQELVNEHGADALLVARQLDAVTDGVGTPDTAARCSCARPMLDGETCVRCGREP